MASPRPSLPVFGTERPPVATITASAVNVRPSSHETRHRAQSGTKSLTLMSVTSSTPSRRAHSRSPSRTSRALCDAGKSFSDSASSSSGVPTSSSKKRICSSSGHDRMMRRRIFGDESVMKRDSSTREGSTLQRPPPLIRIFRPPSFVRSSSVVRAPARAAKIAAIVPAAPAPMTRTCLRLSTVTCATRVVGIHALSGVRMGTGANGARMRINRS